MYKRVLLKLSGEALSSPEAAFDPEILKRLAIRSRIGNCCRWWQLHSW